MQVLISTSLSSSPLMRSCCLVLLIAFGTGCSDGPECDEEGKIEEIGIRCCAGGCGMSTSNWLPRICRDQKWECQKGEPEDACASPQQACSPMQGCHTVGLNKEEPDPAPELCCEVDCQGTKAVHRICKSGTTWECPGGTVPVSKCDDYKTACGGILDTYKNNSWKLPK